MNKPNPYFRLALAVVGVFICGSVFAAPTIRIDDVTVTEGGTATFTVSLSAPTRKTVTVIAGTANGNAVAPGDYTARSNVKLTFPVGTTTQTFAVGTINDTLVEPTETFNVNLSGATNASIADAQGVGTIIDNDKPAVSINDVTVTEGATAGFTVSLSAPSNQTVTVIASTANGSAVAPGDYTARSNVTLTFPAGVTSRSFAVTTINDTLFEPTETFSVNLSGATNATIADARGVGTIVDNDTAPLPTLSINDVTVAEGGTAGFTVSLSAPSSQTVTVVARTANASAVAPGDYTARSNVTLTFPAGTTSQSFSVTTINDTLVEPTETFNVILSGATNAGIADAQGVGTIVDNDQAGTRPNVSINSTSQSRASFPSTAVPQQVRTSLSNFQVLAVNDLGMHCGDLDTRIASILPPFNVLHAQVVRKGTTGASKPIKLAQGDVTVLYSAATNPNDPVLTNSAAILDPAFAGVYKTNFWDVARGAYDPFYPPAILPLFYPSSSNILDLGLPMPDLERLYLGDGMLAASQQDMPGRFFPYDSVNGNPTKPFTQFVGTQPFFTSFPFGYTAPVSWFEAAGIPITTFDDFGRENPYPLMRVQAVAASGNSLGVAAGTVLASLDTVIPVSGEANCKACHAAAADGGNGAALVHLSGAAVSIDDPQFGGVPLPVSVEWATDKNILKLHDVKHATALITGTTADFPSAGTTAFQPVVCQTCHYSPALDLAHVGPNNVNGRQQGNMKSMSAVMHAAHANVTATNGQQLFPDMPLPVNRDALTTETVLEQTCYQCHPGKRTKCLRGAMGQAGVVCQDCHGNMSQVGNDFSRNQPGGGFLLSPDFYTNANTPRVPWANQPGCGSCHTGDAVSNLTASTGAIKASDNIRLLQAYRLNDPKATPIVPTNKRFAENVVTAAENAAAAGNPKLYRVSTGHGGLFCQACHGSTHAEWAASPTNPNANDNVTAVQLQGHTGTIMECSTCHSGSTGNNLNGPHGMHPVGSSSWISGHEDLAESTTQKNACRACHGQTGQGTPLSRVPVARIVGSRTFAKGEQVTCTKCHGNKL